MSSLCIEPVTTMALRLRDRFNLNMLVETGTFHGKSTAWAAQNFASVATIEIRADLFLAASDYHRSLSNVTFYLGDSRMMLPRVLRSADQALFWLDGHNADGIFGDGPDDCPVLSEIDAIFARRRNDCILIDDANCFSPPRSSEWPQLETIIERAADAGYVVGVVHDVIALLPRAAEPDLRWFLETPSGGEGCTVADAHVIKKI